MKKIIAKIANIIEMSFDFFTPSFIANVFTPCNLSPSISSHPFMTSRDNNRKNEVKKK